MPGSYYPKIILPVRRNLQDKKYDCGPASLKIVLDTLGLSIGEEKLMKMAHTTSDGTPPKSLIKVLKDLRVKHEVSEHASLELLENKIRNFNLCLIDYQAYGSGGRDFKCLNTGHYSVVFGFNKTHFYVADPAKHHTDGIKKWGARKIRKDELTKHWQDQAKPNIKTYHWLIAIPLTQKVTNMGRRY